MRQRDRDRAANVLDKAADLISRPGAWMRGNYSNAYDPNEQTCFCSVGAIAKVATGDARAEVRGGLPQRAVVARVALNKLLPTDLVKYNDEIAKDKQQVIRKMRKAAKLLREGKLL